MYTKSPVKKSKKPYLLLIPALLVAAGGALFALEKYHVTNFYTKKSNSPSQDRPVNSQSANTTTSGPTNAIDYGAAKPEDTTVTPDKNPNPDTPATNLELGATITSMRNNSTNTAYLIKVAVSGTDSGTCKVTMTKGSKVSSSTSSISLSGGQYSCTDLSIPLSELNEQGVWQVSVVVTDKNGATSSTSAEAKL